MSETPGPRFWWERQVRPADTRTADGLIQLLEQLTARGYVLSQCQAKRLAALLPAATSGD